MKLRRQTRPVIVAAHGSRGSGASRIVQSHVERLRSDFGFRSVVACFHQGSPGFHEVLDRVPGRRVTVVPFFSSDGYYSSVVLPEALRLNERFRKFSVLRTAAVGAAPGIPRLVLRRALSLARALGFLPGRTSLLIVGHGTRRHSGNRLRIESVVESLRETSPFLTVESAFLDESPRVEEVFPAMPARQRLIVPFLMGGGEHVSTDLPGRLGLSDAAATFLSPKLETHSESAPVGFGTESEIGVVFGRVGPSALAIDRPIGCDPSLARIIADLATIGKGEAPGARDLAVAPAQVRSPAAATPISEASDRSAFPSTRAEADLGTRDDSRHPNRPGALPALRRDLATRQTARPRPVRRSPEPLEAIPPCAL